MRLLDTWTGEFRWVNDPSQERYAILSHVWSSEGEQTYHDLLEIQTSLTTRPLFNTRKQGQKLLRWVRSRVTKTNCPLPSAIDDPGPRPASIFTDARLSDKILYACAVARADGYRSLWIDSCCIDKSSSAELSEAINSMYKWYRWANVCYVHLPDVDDDDSPYDNTSQFRCSVWHTRGWTLQELIAPDSVVFLSRSWVPIGTKGSLATVVEEVTGIDRAVLENPASVFTVSVARRMSWASRRKTTRVEDEAYSLMGIFGVHMPTIYGEGRHAFTRLQLEILHAIPDQSIFAWGGSIANVGRESLAAAPLGPSSYLPRLELELLATSTKHFASSSARVFSHKQFVATFALPLDTPPPTYAATSYGIRTRLPVLLHPTIRVRRPDGSMWLYEPDCIAILECQDELSRFITLPLCLSTGTDSHDEYVVAISRGVLFPSRLWPVSVEDLTLDGCEIAMKDIIIRGGLPQPKLLHARPSPMRERVSDEVVLHNWSRMLLGKHGYTLIQQQKCDNALQRTHTFVINHTVTSESITIHMTVSEGSPSVHLEVGYQSAVAACRTVDEDDTDLISTTGWSGSSNDGVFRRQCATYRFRLVTDCVQHLHVTVSRSLADDSRFKYGVEIVLHRCLPSTSAPLHIYPDTRSVASYTGGRVLPFARKIFSW